MDKWIETLRGLAEFYENLIDPEDDQIAATLDEIIEYLEQAKERTA